jgi:uroporphyrinogen decarboxylase
MIQEMTPRDRVLAALERKPHDRVPYIEHAFDVRVAIGIAGGLENLVSDDQLLRKLNTEGSGGFNIFNLMELEPDISRVTGRDNITYWGAFHPFEFGSYVLDESQAERGFNADGLLKTREDVRHMKFRAINEEFWEPAHSFLDTKGDYAACAMLWLGIDPTWHSMGFEHFAVSLITDPGLVGEFLSRISDWCAEVADGLCHLGFDYIWAADDIACNTSPMFSPDQYREVMLPHTKKVADRITLPWIYHSDGNLLPILDDMLTQGMNAIHPLEPGSMDLADLYEKYGNRLSFVGNINMDTLARGTKEEVCEEVRERIALLGPGNGYLLSSSNSIAEYCGAENVVEMVRAMKEYGKYK